VKRVPVGFGIDRHRLNPQLLAGADYPQGDFTAIGNQDLPKHCAQQRPKLETQKSKLGERKSKLEAGRWTLEDGNQRRFLVASFGLQSPMVKSLPKTGQKMHQFRVSNFDFRVSSFDLPVSNFEFRFSSFDFPIARFDSLLP